MTKNRLAKLALDDTPYAALADLFTGPTAIAFSSDPVAAPKAAVDYAKRNEKLVIIGGALGGSLLDAGEVRALAELPSLDELRGQLVGLLDHAGGAPGQRAAGAGRPARPGARGARRASDRLTRLHGRRLAPASNRKSEEKRNMANLDSSSSKIFRR